MKQKTPFIIGTFATLTVFSLFIFKPFWKDSVSKYSPSPKIVFSEAEREREEAQGSAEWWFNRTKNQVTGQLDFNEMLRIQNLAFQNFMPSTQRNSDQNAVASVSWNELGPDNVGGRTRAIHFDKLDATHTHMFAGGVSGGLWESNNSGNSWHRCAGFFTPTSVNTVTTIAQAANGDLYVGTGEGNFYSAFGTGAGGFLGGGIYKSTDDGLTWNVLSSTVPTNSNNSTIAWAAVNKIQCDPSDASHVFASTNKGFKESHDGGATWTTPNGITSATAVSTDVEVAPNGLVIAVINSKPFRSSDFGATFASVGTTAQGFTNAALGRTVIAIAPSDPNYVYAFCSTSGGATYGLYASIDGAQSWTQVSGAGNSQLEPLGQGTYANAMAVDASNPKRVILGGLDLYEWNMITTNPPAGQWNRLTQWNAWILSPVYVHADLHTIVFHPTLPGNFYVGCDGGIFNTFNGGTSFHAMNSGYNVTQCYSVAYDNHSTNRNIAMAGCQDNGTNYIDGNGNTSMSSNAVGGGDGAWCEMSYLNNQAIFGTVYYGALARSNNNGASSSQFYSDKITSLSGFEQAGFASFVTPVRLWESEGDLLTGDTIRIANSLNVQNKHVTNGDSSHFSGTLSVPYPTAVPAPTIVLSSVRFIASNGDSLNSDASGVFTGDGTGSIGTNGVYSITFTNTPVANVTIHAEFNVQYSAGTLFTVNSNVQGRTLSRVATSQVNPGDTFKIQDIIQSHMAVGFSGSNGIWFTRRAIDFSTNPEWYRIGGAHSTPNAFGGECSCLCWSADGNYLYAGTATGNVYRFANLASVTDTINGSIDAGAAANPYCQTTCTLIGSFAGRDVSAIDVNPNNNDEVIVSLGNYGNTAYVYYTNIATTATSNAGTFVDKTGNLDNIGGVPTYSLTFDKYSSTARVLVGTEHGVYETSNITAAAPTWTSANTGLDNVPVDMIRQQRRDPWLVANSGCFYIGTHGRGMWRDDSSWQQPTGINNPIAPYTDNAFINNHDLRIFPNPVIDNSHVTFNLSKAGDASVQIYDLTGKLVYNRKYEQLTAGANTVEFETGEMVKGTYIIVVLQGEKQMGTGRFVKMDY